MEILWACLLPPEVIIVDIWIFLVFAISVITDLGVPGKIKKVTHKEIQKVSEVAEPKFNINH